MIDNKKNIAAFFDVDGTISRESLLIEHFKMLVKHEYININAWNGKVKEKFKKWETRKGDYDDYLLELVENYVECLKGIAVEDIDFIAKRVIELKGEKLYRYSRKKLKEHKEKGHKVIIISGSPHFLVEKMASKYEISDYKASIYETKDGYFTGKVFPMWDSANKNKAIDYYAEKYNIDLSNSYAYGDTTGDYSMFKRVGFPVAINPAMGILQKIKEDIELSKKTKIIVERKDVIYNLNSSVEVE